MERNYALEISTMPNELKLLLTIIQEDNDNNLLTKQKSFTKIDWNLFIQLAIYHRVYPVVYLRIKEMNGIPLYVIQALHQEYKKNIFQMLTLTKEMELVSKLFTENQIPLLFLKGPVIAADIYGDISLRTSKDLDILIPVKDVERVEALLLNLGYEKESLNTVLNDWKWRSHHIVYFHPQKRIMLEIHWRQNPFPSKEPTFRELWERKRESKITSFPVYFFGEEDLFSYLVSHGARHGWFRLRWLLDIDRMIRKGVNFNKIDPIVQKNRKSHLIGQAFVLTSELLKTPIDNNVMGLMKRNDSRKLAQDSIEFINGMDSIDDLLADESFKKYYRSLNNSEVLLNSLMMIYPSTSDLKILPLPKSLHFLYFPLRPFLAVARRIKGSK